MKSEDNDITNQQNNIISFVFDHQETSLVIHAQTDKILYCAHFQPNPYVSFDSLKDSLQSGDFKIVCQNNEVMKVKVSKVIDLDFVSKDKIVIDELRQSILKLNQKLQT